MPDDIPTMTIRPDPKPDAAKPAKLSYDDMVSRWTARGYPKPSAQGIADNMMRESKGDPSIVGDGGTSRGLFQHHAERKAALEAEAKKQGKSPDDPDLQIAFADQELKRDYPTLQKQLMAGTDRGAAEDSFKRVFERPASVMWQNKPGGGGPTLASDRFRWSDYALDEHKDRPNTDVRMMAPQDYLDLTPDLEGAPFKSPSGRSLVKSVNDGDEIQSIPSLDMRVSGNTGTVTDQDGRHRALLAQQEGLDAIPVAVKKTGQADGGGEPTEIQGMDGTILPHTFPKADTVPKSLFRQAVDAVIPSAEAAEPARKIDPDNPFLKYTQPPSQTGAEQPSGTAGPPKIDPDNPFAKYLPPDQQPADNMVVSGLKGVAAGAGKVVSGGEELLGKGLEAASDLVSPPKQSLSGLVTGAEPQRGMVGRAGEFLVDNARKRVGRIDDYTAADMKAHPWVTGEAETAGSLAMQLALTKGKGGVGKTNAMRAVSGGALTALLDPVGSDEGGYWWAKALAVGMDASMGLAGNALAERVAKWIEPQMRPIREFIERVTGKSVKQNPAAAAVIDRMEKDARAGGPTAQDMIDLANKTPDKPLTIADVGGPEIQGLTGRVVRAPGEGRAKLTNFLNKRDEGAGERLAEDINRDIGRDSSYQLAKTMKTSRAAAAEPLYEAAYGHPPISPDEMVPSGGTQRAGSIGALLDRPSVRAGIANARKIAKEEGVDLSTLGVDLDPQGVPVFTKVPTWKALDYIKRGIDDVVEQFRDPTSGRLALDDYGHAANATRTEFRNALKQLNPKYANALDAYSGASTSLDALHAGEDFLKRSPEEIADRVATFGTGDREFYRLGAANTLRRAVQKAKFSADEAKAIINSQDMRNQIRPLFDNDADFARFVDSVFAEGRMFGTRFNALGGSQTAARRAEDTSPEIEGLVHAARGMLHAKTGNAMGVVNALRGVREAAAAARQRKANPGIADILTTPIDPTGAGVRDFASHMASLPNSALNATRNRLAQLSRAAGPAIGVGVANQLGPQQQQPGGQ